jgi:hypothetical protein
MKSIQQLLENKAINEGANKWEIIPDGSELYAKGQEVSFGSDIKYLLIYLDGDQIIGVNNSYLDDCVDEEMLDASDVKKIKAMKVGASLCIDGNNTFIRIA